MACSPLQCRPAQPAGGAAAALGAGNGTSAHNSSAGNSSPTEASFSAWPGSKGCSTHRPSVPKRCRSHLAQDDARLALQRYAQGGVDLHDCLSVALATPHKARVLTFDARAARKLGMELPR